MVSISRGFRKHPEQDVLLKYKAIIKNDNEFARELWSTFTRREIFRGLIFQNFQIGEDACFFDSGESRVQQGCTLLSEGISL